MPEASYRFVSNTLFSESNGVFRYGEMSSKKTSTILTQNGDVCSKIDLLLPFSTRTKSQAT